MSRYGKCMTLDGNIIGVDEVEILVWPDLGWCHTDDLEEVLQSRSDDFMSIIIDIDDDPEQIISLMAKDGKI